MASITTLTAEAYKRWPASVPATNTPTTLIADAQDIESVAATLVAEGELSVDNWDDVAVSMYGEAVSPFDSDYPTKGVLVETIWRPRTAGGGGSGNLSVARDGSSVTVVNSAGDDAVLPAANTSQAGVMSASDKTKLDGIEAGAQVNPSAATIVATIDTELGQTNWHSGTPFYDAAALGVVADDLTDNTSALNSAIDTVFTAGGGYIVLPYGRSRVSGQITWKSGVHLVGHGDASVIYVMNTLSANTTIFKTPGVSSPVTDVSLSDFKIELQTGGTAAGFVITGVGVSYATGFRVERVSFVNIDSPVSLSQCSRGRVVDNSLGAASFYGIRSDVNVSLVEVARNYGNANDRLISLIGLIDSVVHDNHSDTANLVGILISGTNCAVYDNRVDDSVGIGYDLTLTDGLIYGNITTGALTTGMKLAGTRCDVNGNRVASSSVSSSNTYDAIDLAGLTNSLVHGNRINVGGNERYAIQESLTADGNTLYDNVVFGNPVTGDYNLVGVDSHIRVHATETAAAAISVGTALGPVGLAVTSNGTAVTASAYGTAPSQDFQVVFSDEIKTFDGDTTTVSLTAGTNTAPQVNYVYFLESTKALTASTSGWPAAAHVPFATVMVQSASNAQTDGVHALSMVAQPSGGLTAYRGALSDVNQWIREQPPRWISGGAITPTVTTQGAGPDDIDLATTAATLLRRERITFPSRDTAATDSVYIYNHSTTPYNKVGTLGTVLQTTSGGASISDGQHVSIVVWGAASETTTISKLYVNLPSGFYTLQTEAQCDAKRYTSYTIPEELKSSAFLIARMVFKYEAASSGTWTHVATYDLRGRAIDSTRDGNPPFSREFLDTEFKIRDNADPTKVVRFETSGITTATERTVTAPDASGTLSLLEVAQSFSAGAKKTFSHSATTAGVNLGPVAGDPSSPADGDVWYNSTLNKFRKRENGVTTDLDTQGSASPLGNDNDFQYNNGGAFGGASGFVYNEAQNRPYAVNGIEFGEVTSPAMPSTNRSLLYGRDIATLTRPYFVTSLGLPFEFAIAQSGERQIGYWWAQPESATVNNGYRLTFSNHGSGSLASYTPTNADSFSKYARVRATTTTSSNITAGVRAGTKWMMMTHGFFIRLRFGIATPATGWSGFAGLTSSAAALSGGADPSSYTNIIGVGWDTADTNLFMIHNDGTGTATKVDLGSGFPTGNTGQDIYDLTLYCAASGSQVEYTVTRVEGGSGQTASGTLSSDLPSTSLALGFQSFASNRTSAVAIAYDAIGFYWETPF